MTPSSLSEAHDLLLRLGAPARLIRHAELVAEAAEALLAAMAGLRVKVAADFVRVGAVLHDAGKVLHGDELDRAGAEHEPAGERLLLEHGASPDVARVCRSHAQWAEQSPPASLEELLIALADKLWKGVRRPELEERVVVAVAEAIGGDRWKIFIQLDATFETIAAGADARLARSRT